MGRRAELGAAHRATLRPVARSPSRNSKPRRLRRPPAERLGLLDPTRDSVFDVTGRHFAVSPSDMQPGRSGTVSRENRRPSLIESMAPSLSRNQRKGGTGTNSSTVVRPSGPMPRALRLPSGSIATCWPGAARSRVSMISGESGHESRAYCCAARPRRRFCP